MGRGNLGDIHRTDGRSQSDTDSAQHTIEVEGNQQVPVGLSVFEEKKLRIVGTQCGEEKHDGSQTEGIAPPQTGGQITGYGAADDATYQCTGRGDAVHHLVILKIRRGEEKGFKAFLGTGNHCRVVAEQQSAQDGYGGNGVQVQSVSFLCQIHDDSFDVKLINFIMFVRTERLAHAVQFVVQLTVEFVVPRGPVGYAGLEFFQRKHIFHLGNPFVEIANVEFPVIYRFVKCAEFGCGESLGEKVEQGSGLRLHVLPHEP